MQRPFINHIDTRRGCLFSQHVFKQNTQLAHTPPPFNHHSEFTKHYRLREDYTESELHDNHHPPRPQPSVSESMLTHYSKLKETCSNYDLNIVTQGKFFMVVSTAKERLLQGFITPQADKFCVFFRGPCLNETVQCPDAVQAETYVKSIFCIEEDENQLNQHQLPEIEHV